MPHQLTFDLPHRTAQGRDDFFIAGPNAIAVAMVDGWADWPLGKLLIAGPKGAGKSHLAQVWADQSGAVLIPAGDLTPENAVDKAGDGHIVVEDIDRIAGNATAEQGLFHLHNLVLARKTRLLMTSRLAPSQIAFDLKDLQSRVEGTQVAQLDPPDDQLMAALLVKLFADRQLQIEPRLIPFLLSRMERSFACAEQLVQALDRAALQSGHKIGERLAGRVLSEMEH